MIGRVVLAALLAGIAAGLVMGAIQHVRITPLILEAEVYERTPAAHQHGSAAANQQTNGTGADQSAEWEPADGLERTLFTVVASAMTGAGFALLLAGISLLSGLPITPRNGVIWGLCGFLAFTIAPGAGLPPELPAMAAADLLPRQIWWTGTIAATGAGLYLIATQPRSWAIPLAVVLIAAPHVIGAPQPPTLETPIPAGLATEFAANTHAAAAVFWCCIGLFLGLAFDHFAKGFNAA